MVLLGTPWSDALAMGKVFNTMDGCAKLGLDAGQLAARRAKAKAAKELVRLGSGVFCCMVKVAGKTNYIVHGFTMPEGMQMVRSFDKDKGQDVYKGKDKGNVARTRLRFVG